VAPDHLAEQPTTHEAKEKNDAFTQKDVGGRTRRDMQVLKENPGRMLATCEANQNPTIITKT
jgi:hypothetical protein